jgi:hypothetical protein
MTQAIQPTHPDTFRVGINPKLLEKARNFFNASLTDILNELLQNARRAGANRVTITYDPASLTLTIADDGSGIFRDGVALDLGGSGWDGATQASEDPAGCGLFSLASRTCTIESCGKKIALDERKFCGQEDVTIERGDESQGTRISFPLTEFEARSYRSIAEACTLYYPLPVLLDGEQLPRKDFLAAALYRHSWAGLTLGVVEHHWKTQINFHGLVIDTHLPKVEWHWNRTLTVWIDVIDCPQLQLVLPARKEVVRNQFFENLKTECHQAIYQYIAIQSANGNQHQLPYQDWLHAQELGINLPDAEPTLEAYAPATANPDDWESAEEVSVAERTIVFDADLEPPDAQAFWRGFEDAGLPYCLVAAWDKYRGYSWYDKLPTLSDVTFRIQLGDRTLTPEEAATEAGQARPDEIVITATIAHSDGTSETISFTTDIAFYVEELFYWSEMECVTLFVTKGSTIEVECLVELLKQSFFYPSDDSSSDSWTTQEEDFTEEATSRAYKILSCEEVARQERIRLVVDRHLRWLLPRGQETAIRLTSDGAVAVEFRE